MLIVVWAVIAVVWLCLVLLVYAPVAAGRAIGRAWRHARPRRPSAAE
jgi:Na+-transporting methylmalonyl-CoA/oxaloacetate decarboxylase gamma subunit